MNLDNLNSLVELFFIQVDKQDQKSIFLQWLNPNNKKTLNFCVQLILKIYSTIP